MANTNLLEAFKMKLQALQEATRGSASRGMQMQSSLGGLGESIRGGFGDITGHLRGLAKEKRGYQQEEDILTQTGTQAESLQEARAEDAEGLQKLIDNLRNISEGVGGPIYEAGEAKAKSASDREANALRNKILSLLGLDPAAVEGEDVTQTAMELERAGASVGPTWGQESAHDKEMLQMKLDAAQKERDDLKATAEGRKLSDFMDERWIQDSANIPRKMGVTGREEFDFENYDWEPLRASWIADAADQGIDMEAGELERRIDLRMTSLRSNPLVDADQAGGVGGERDKKGITPLKGVGGWMRAKAGEFETEPGLVRRLTNLTTLWNRRYLDQGVPRDVVANALAEINEQTDYDLSEAIEEVQSASEGRTGGIDQAEIQNIFDKVEELLLSGGK